MLESEACAANCSRDRRSSHSRSRSGSWRSLYFRYHSYFCHLIIIAAAFTIASCVLIFTRSEKVKLVVACARLERFLLCGVYAVTILKISSRESPTARAIYWGKTSREASLNFIWKLSQSHSGGFVLAETETLWHSAHF